MFNFSTGFQTEQLSFDSVLADIKEGRGQLVDIREKSEWEANHFEDAIHIPLSELSRGIGIEKLRSFKEQQKKIYLHCLSGNRVMMAKRLLAGFGCTEISILPTTMQTMHSVGFELVH